MKIALIIGGVWLLLVLFYLALFKAAARGDRFLKDDIDSLENSEDLK